MKDRESMWILYMGWRSHKIALKAYAHKPEVDEIVQYITNQYSMYDYDEYEDRVLRIHKGERIYFERFGPDGIETSKDFYWLEERKLYNKD